MIRVVVLTSRENFVWYSMQEIIPYIESCWEKMNSDEFEVVTFNIDSLSLAELTPKLIGADRLVITCFNYRMCKVMQYIREILKLNLNFVVHVHNLSTIAFWPYRYFSSSDLFFKSDVFITSCQNDKKVLETIFEGPNIHVIPFFIKHEIRSIKEVLEKPRNIVYVGRISPQKNLHNLLLAYSFLKNKFEDQIPSLILFGKEDHLGSPNMNIRNESYLEFLQSLAEKLNITSSVFFKGHIDRDLIEDFLRQRSNLFVSASLHSDENFGMAALQSILAKNRTLLSDWGGHSDFKKYFSSFVDLMPVSESDFGPSLNADTIAASIWTCLSKGEEPIEFKIDNYYSESFYIEEQKRAVSKDFDSSALMYSTLANQVYEAKMDYTTSSTQIFLGFQDPLFHQISKFYIGETSQPHSSTKDLEYFAVPWMTYTDEIFMVDDPHKGPLLIQNDKAEVQDFQIKINDTLTVKVSQSICEKLFRCGYINKSV